MSRLYDRRTLIGLAAMLLYGAAVVLPNYLITRYGVVDVVPGPWTLMAPAAVYAVGFVLVARDVVDDILGLPGVLGAIIGGTLLSALFASPGIVVASAVAFVCSELLDLGVYRGIRAAFGPWSVAAVLSSIVGAALDSFVFLTLAYHSLAFFEGQWVGKTVAIVLTVAVAAPLRRFWTREPAPELVDA